MSQPPQLLASPSVSRHSFFLVTELKQMACPEVAHSHAALSLQATPGGEPGHTAPSLPLHRLPQPSGEPQSFPVQFGVQDEQVWVTVLQVSPLETQSTHSTASEPHWLGRKPGKHLPKPPPE